MFNNEFITLIFILLPIFILIFISIVSMFKYDKEVNKAHASNAKLIEIEKELQKLTEESNQNIKEQTEEIKKITEQIKKQEWIIKNLKK